MIYITKLVDGKVERQPIETTFGIEFETVDGSRFNVSTENEYILVRAVSHQGWTDARLVIEADNAVQIHIKTDLVGNR